MSDVYGRRLVCSVLHDEARRNPNRLFAIVAKTNNVSDGYYHITFAQVSRATKYVAKWLQDRFEAGANPIPQTTLAYIGVSDIRYNIIFYAAIQCRYKLFVPSPRNVPATNTSLLTTTECFRLVYAPEVDSIVKQLCLDSPNIQSEPFLAVTDLLDVPDVKYTYDFRYDQLWKEPVIVLHSSGSTGFPKPITWTHGSIAALDYRGWRTVEGRRNHDFAASLTFEKNEGRLLDFFPPFHAGGVMFKVLTPIWNLSVPIFGPALRPPSGALAAQIMRELQPDGIVLPPSICEQLAQEPDSQHLFERLNFLMYGGGPMSKAAGDKITSCTTVIQAFACTETPHIRQLVTQPEDWEYIEFHPDERMDLRPHGDDLYEMVFRIKPEYERDLVLYHNFPDQSTWSSGDLFRCHHSNPNLYKFHGRLDDIIVFSSGEKLFPLPMEMALTGMHGVSGAIVVGQGYSQAALLVETSLDAFSGPNAHQELLSAVEATNALMPAHGRVSKDMIIIADADRPFQRAAKGSVIRKLTQELYREEIESLFTRKAPLRTTCVAAFTRSAFRLEDIRPILRSILVSVSIDPQISDTDNFYMYGMNSIKTVEAVNSIKSSLSARIPGTNLDWLSMELLYQYPTISELASVFLSVLNKGSLPTRPDRVQEMGLKVAQHTRDLPEHLDHSRDAIKKDRFSIAITGTTGFLGPHLLNALLHAPRISQVYCLNRSRGSDKNSNPDHMSPGNGTGQIHMQCDLSKPKLGLTEEEYSQLLNNCDLILHNAWTVNFNLPLASFDSHLEGVRQLINLSNSANNRPRIVFVSTTAATVTDYDSGHALTAIPERPIRDADASMPMGYAESKRVAERMLDIASTQVGTPSTVIRLGHLVPTEAGVLPADDCLTAFVQTCRGLGLIADDFINSIDWLKVDDAARIIMEIVTHELDLASPPTQSYLNVINPNKRPWGEYMDVVEQWSGRILKRVSMQDWVSVLNQQHTADTETMKKLPALRMLPMMDVLKHRGMDQNYEQGASRRFSPSIDELAAVSTSTFGS